MKAMILAAGRGKRLKPFTDSTPKPLIKINNKPLICYHLEKLAKAGVKEVIINTAWLGEQITQALGDGEKWGLKISYSHESEALETGGGIKKALPLLGDDPFLVINGDIFIDELPASITDFVMPENALACLWLVENPKHNPDGDYALKVNQIIESKNDKLTFSGIGIYRKELFNDSPNGAFATPLLFNQAIQKKQLFGEKLNGYWNDVGTPQRLEEVNQRFEQGR
ncbi:mannose-1-phosphate guanylyltransferase [Shewanella sp. OPT22]|nr:mannose-1-phosphate guanylyltransferase [Shewanella sp. OPT22]